MRLLRRRAATASARPLLEEIRRAVQARGSRPDRAADERLLELRHRAGLALLERPEPVPAVTSPAGGTADGLRTGAGSVPEVDADALTPWIVRTALDEQGCLLVRGLLDGAGAERLAADIDRAYAGRQRHADGEAAEDGWFQEFQPDPRFDLAFERAVMNSGGWAALWAADSPSALEDVLDAFEGCGLREVVASVLGEHPAISVNKCVLRRVQPDVFGESDPPDGAKPSAWHQDGAFMGPVKALNVWLALSRCGDVAPGMDIVPRRLGHMAETGTEGAAFPWSVSRAVAEREAGPGGIARPVFDPGDALLFDEMLLHSTAAEPDMPNARYAVESWFFAPSAFPGDYAPLAF